MNARVVLKQGVKIHDIQPQMILFLQIACGVWNEFAVRQLVVTSGSEGKHMATSLHYKGLAVDLRWPIDVPRENLVIRLRSACGQTTGPKGQQISNWDIVPESDHLHVEYQPKG